MNHEIKHTIDSISLCQINSIQFSTTKETHDIYRKKTSSFPFMHMICIALASIVYFKVFFIPLLGFW